MAPLARTGLVAALGLAAGLAACGQSDNLEFFSPGDAKMNAAIDQARKTLPVFWAKLDSGDPAISDPLVKVGLPNAHQSLEHIWMTVEDHSSVAVHGRLVNDPFDLPGLHRRDEINVDNAKISDWAYTKAGRQYGAFSLRVMAARAKGSERTELQQGLAPTPLEPGDH